MNQSLFWHDYETSGINPSFDQPLQFAGIRTNENLDIIGDPIVLFCKPHLDIIPSPQACLVTGISLQQAYSEGLKEPDFISTIHAEMIKPGTCSVGYNSIKFDDEFTRFTLYRNFFDPYEREWKNGNTRWDILDMMRLARALRPEGIEWPNHLDGKPSFKLEDLTRANGIDHSDAHDALSDVYATISIAKLIKSKQPKLFDYLYNIRKKHEVEKIISTNDKRPFFYVSGILSSHNMYGAVMLPLAKHPENKNAMICWNLMKDPSCLINNSVETLQENFFNLHVSERSSDIFTPLIISLNKAPAVTPINLITPEIAQKLALDMEICRLNMEKVIQFDISEKLRQIYQLQIAQSTKSAESALYSGFIPNEDIKTAETVRNASMEDFSKNSYLFNDNRMNELLFLYRGRNYPESFSQDERKIWKEICCDRLVNGIDGRKSINKTRDEITCLKQSLKSEKAITILNQLMEWLSVIERDFNTNLE